METPGKRVAAMPGDEGPTIIEMEDPDVESFAGGERRQKNPRNEPVGGDMGGEKKAAVEEQTAPRAATSSTFDGLGVRGGLSLAGVTDQKLGDQLQGMSDEFITLLLDASVHQHSDAVGLRKALEEDINRLALEWSTTIEKVMDVVWLSLRRAYRVLDAGGEKAIVLRNALASIFCDGKDQRSLEHFLSQTGFLLNDWSGSKPLCLGCLDKCGSSAEYGYDEGIIASRILRVKPSVPVGEFVPLPWVKAHLPDKLREDGFVYVGEGRVPRPRQNFGEFEEFKTVGARKVSDNDWKQLLKCRDGDVLIVDDRVDFQAAVDFVPVSMIWCAESRTKLDNPVLGWVPKKCIELVFRDCTCHLWNTDWKPWTDIVMDIIRVVKENLPSQNQLSERLVADSSTLSDKAKRLHAFIKCDLQLNGGHLKTALSPSFLDANVPELQVALNNLLDTEQGGADLRAWTRVFSMLAAVERIGPGEGDKLVCQVLNRKALKEIVRDVLGSFVITGGLSSGFGLLWRPPIRSDVGAGLERCPAGWKTAGHNADISAVAPPEGEFQLAKLGDSISQGETLKYAPFPFLRGVKEVPTTFTALCQLECRLVLISCADAGAAFESSLGGTLTRQLLAPLLKQFRNAIIVVASPAWCTWWKTQLSAASKGKAAKKRKQRDVVEILIGGNDGLPSGQELLACSEAEQAAGVRRWYDFANSVTHKDEEEEQEDAPGADGDVRGADDEGAPVAVANVKGPKKTLIQYFHNTCGPLYPISVSDEAFNAVQANGVNIASALTEAQVVELTKPLEWLFSDAVHPNVSIYGGGRGVVVSDLQVSDYEHKLDLFLSGHDSFFAAAVAALGMVHDFAGVCSALSAVKRMPFTLARLPVNLASDFVHLFLGQDYKEGWTFANHEGGSSVPVRFVHRKSGLADNQFATYDVLPCNHDWKHDLDYFVSCSACRPALEEQKKYDNLRHITPALPDEPKTCAECKRRWTRVMEWLCLQLAAMVQAVALSGAKIFVTPAGSIARAVFNRTCRVAPLWLRALQLQMPTRDVCHPNAVSFSRTEGQIRSRRADYGRLVVELRNFRSGSTSQRWEGGMSKFYAELHSVFDPFNPAILNTKRMAAAKAARDVLTPLVEREVRAINMLIGRADSLEPIDLRFRLTRLICQMHLQKLAVSAELAGKIAAVAELAEEKRAPAAVAAGTVVRLVGDLSRNEKSGFFRQCNVYLVDRLSDPDSVRRPLLERLGLQVRVLDPAVEVISGRSKGWKQSAGQSFEKCVSSLFGKWRHRQQDLKILVAHGPASLLDCLSRVAGGDMLFVLREDKVQALLQKAPPPLRPAKSDSKPTKAEKNGKPPDGFCFAPKVPVVKTVFETKLSSGMFLVSRTVAAEIIVSAARRVLDPGNLEGIGLSAEMIAENVPERVVRAALLASFDLQREHFGTGVEGTRADFLSGLDRIFKCKLDGSSYQCMDHVACADKGISKSFLLSLFDYRRVIAKSHYGKVVARTDGRSLNLTGLLPSVAREGKKKSDEQVLEEKRGMFQQLLKKLDKEANDKVEKLEAKVEETGGADVRWQTELEVAEKERDEVEVLFVGLDCGKSGLNAAMAPHVIRKAVKYKAQAEAELAEAERVENEESIADAKAVLEEATMIEAEARQLFENAQLPSSSTSRPDLSPLRKNRSEKGAHSITKGCRRSELLEVQLRKAREERLKVFDECFVEKSGHGAMLQELVKLSSVAFDPDAELAAVKSRLSVYRLLKIAYNSGAQRKERRTTAIKRRGFTARATRLLTKDLPETVLRAPPDKFLAKSLPFPKRSPQSRQRDKVRGWERGVNRAMGAIEASKSTCRLPVWIATDMFSGKGQRISSTFPFQEVYRSMLRHIRSRPKLAARVMVYVDNGYRSSRQAAGTLCYLANMERADHRKVQALNCPDDWLGPVQDGFGYFYCPVTNAILKRDPPASLSMGTIGTCTFFNAPHPQIWAPALTAAE